MNIFSVLEQPPTTSALRYERGVMHNGYEPA